MKKARSTYVGPKRSQGPQGPQQLALVAYHANCIDGFTSAFITHEALVASGLEVKLLAMEHKAASVEALLQELDTFEYAELYIVDYSLEVSVLHQIGAEHPLMISTLLDHHKTAFERYSAPGFKVLYSSYLEDQIATTFITLDNYKSSAGICWSYFHSGLAPVPALVKYVQDYDLWAFDYGDHTRWVNKYLKGQEMTVKNWSLILERMDTPLGLQRILREGSKLQAKHDKRVSQIALEALDFFIDGIGCLIVECSPEFTSDVGHTLAEECGTFGVMYAVDMENYEVTYSLRSNGDAVDAGVDVSAIAKEHGGGGHRNAAGFTETLDKFNTRVELMKARRF